MTNNNKMTLAKIVFLVLLMCNGYVLCCSCMNTSLSDRYDSSTFVVKGTIISIEDANDDASKYRYTLTNVEFCKKPDWYEESTEFVLVTYKAAATCGVDLGPIGNKTRWIFATYNSAEDYAEIFLCSNMPYNDSDIAEYCPYKCYSILYNSSAVCSRRGKCLATDKCACNDGFGGARCQTRCASGFKGPTCKIPRCFGTWADNPSVCSGHGRCTRVNVCSCNSGWRGNRCHLTNY